MNEKTLQNFIPILFLLSSEFPKFHLPYHLFVRWPTQGKIALLIWPTLLTHQPGGRFQAWTTQFPSRQKWSILKRKRRKNSRKLKRSHRVIYREMLTKAAQRKGDILKAVMLAQGRKSIFLWYLTVVLSQQHIFIFQMSYLVLVLIL